jgi:hypothetical protein
MNVSVSRQQAGLGIMGGTRFLLDTWRRLTPRHIVAGFALGAALWLWNISAGGGIRAFLTEPNVRRWILQDLFHNELIALGLVLAVAAADRAVAAGRAGRSAYVWAVGLAAVVVTPIVHAFHPFADRPWLSSTVYAAACWMMFGGLATFVYVDRKRALATSTRLAAAELERTRQLRHVLETRLQAMQARVEPRFLFNTLAHVRQLYEADPSRAEVMLEELIAYLRAAMPHMRDSASTLAQEIDLVRAYLGIVKVRLRDHLDYVFDVSKDNDNVRVPAMVLLPLIDHAIARGPGQATYTGVLRIATEVANRRLRITIADSGAGFSPDATHDDVTSIRERLIALYGDAASLMLRSLESGSSEAVMEIPSEAVEDIAR